MRYIANTATWTHAASCFCLQSSFVCMCVLLTYVSAACLACLLMPV